MTRSSWLSLLFLGALWGASYMFIKIGLEDLSPAMIVLVRCALAALVLVPFAAARGGLGGLRSVAGLVALLGAVQVAAPFLLISAGEQAISSSLTGILISSTPLFTALLAIWIDQAERSTGPRALGLVAGFVGVAFLIGVDVDGGQNALLGAVAVVLAALGYAIGGFVVKRSTARTSPLAIAGATMVVASVLVAPIAAATAPASLPGLGTVAAMAFLGLVGTGLAFAIFYTLTAEVGPARAALVTYIAPVFAVIYGVTLLGESFTVATLIGLGLILGGSWVAAGESLTRRRRILRAVPAYGGTDGSGAPAPGEADQRRVA